MRVHPERRIRGRRGNAIIEFTLVGIPLVFVLASSFEMARGMWTYHTLAYTIKEATRWSIVHGSDCFSGSQSCNHAYTQNDVATVIRNAGIGLESGATQCEPDRERHDYQLQSAERMHWKHRHMARDKRPARDGCCDHWHISVSIGNRHVLAGRRPGAWVWCFHSAREIAGQGGLLRLTMGIFKHTRRGQALIMVAMVLFSMLGMIGLVVDLGWSYYIKKSAQAAADAAALAAVSRVAVNGPYSCLGSGFACQAVTTCSDPPAQPSVTNIDAACYYAQLNGFVAGGRQTVTMAADVTSPPPTVPNVNVFYWATARVSQTTPQLFSAILGNLLGTVGARATAGIVNVIVPGTLYALNRERDADPSNMVLGEDVDGGGGGSVTMAGGIYMASTADGLPDYAAVSNGSFSINAAFADFRGSGWTSNSGMFANTPLQNGFPDGSNFMDPMRGKGQPPAPGLNPNLLQYNHPVPGGTINASCDTPLSPGYYYATNANGTAATGGVINFSGCPVFGGSTVNFGQYVFFGGVYFSASPVFGPGQYIFAGALSGNYILNQGNQVTLTDTFPYTQDGKTGAVTWTSSSSTNNAGEILIFTNGTYPGLQVPNLVSTIQPNLTFGDTDIQMGNKNEMILHGLNGNSTNLPSNLQTFAPTIFWQDQRNSEVKYTSDGNIDTTSCGSGHSLDNPCPNTLGGTNPDMNLQAHPMLHMYGVFYQPRGASISFQGHGGIDAPMQLISGAVNMQGGPTINLNSVPDPLSRRIVALIE